MTIKQQKPLEVVHTELSPSLDLTKNSNYISGELLHEVIDGAANTIARPICFTDKVDLTSIISGFVLHQIADDRVDFESQDLNVKDLDQAVFGKGWSLIPRTFEETVVESYMRMAGLQFGISHQLFLSGLFDRKTETEIFDKLNMSPTEKYVLTTYGWPKAQEQKALGEQMRSLLQKYLEIGEPVFTVETENSLQQFRGEQNESERINLFARDVMSNPPRFLMFFSECIARGMYKDSADFIKVAKAFKLTDKEVKFVYEKFKVFVDEGIPYFEGKEEMLLTWMRELNFYPQSVVSLISQGFRSGMSE
jgi:hypothetical protein